jgi:hypothetical protein
MPGSVVLTSTPDWLLQVVRFACLSECGSGCHLRRQLERLGGCGEAKTDWLCSARYLQR